MQNISSDSSCRTTQKTCFGVTLTASQVPVGTFAVTLTAANWLGFNHSATKYITKTTANIPTVRIVSHVSRGSLQMCLECVALEMFYECCGAEMFLECLDLCLE
jgi:hypothetical protein